MSRSRISEGFHRIGLAVAVLCLLASLGFAIDAGVHRAKPEATYEITGPGGRIYRITAPAWVSEAEVADSVRRHLLSHADLTDVTRQFANQRDMHESAQAGRLWAIIWSFAIGLAFYALARALGWIADGFASGANPPLD